MVIAKAMIASTESVMDFEPVTRTERVAVVVMELTNGEELTTAQAAELMCVSRVTAWRILSDLCRVPDLLLTKEGRVWKMLREP